MGGGAFQVEHMANSPEKGCKDVGRLRGGVHQAMPPKAVTQAGHLGSLGPAMEKAQLSYSGSLVCLSLLICEMGMYLLFPFPWCDPAEIR